MQQQPRLLFFYSPQSGRCRRTEGFIAQVLQRRHNHDTFKLVRIAVEQRPDLAELLRIQTVPTLLVVQNRIVRARLTEPKGCREIETLLRPWLSPPLKAQQAEAASPPPTDAIAG